MIIFINTITIIQNLAWCVAILATIQFFFSLLLFRSGQSVFRSGQLWTCRYFDNIIAKITFFMSPFNHIISISSLLLFLTILVILLLCSLLGRIGIRAMDGRCMSFISLQLRSYKDMWLLYSHYGLKSNKFHNYWKTFQTFSIFFYYIWILKNLIIRLHWMLLLYLTCMWDFKKIKN